jgi:signal transduction histidine kinase/DNA-binding response OmpR family regulator/GAF domain-containing protein
MGEKIKVLLVEDNKVDQMAFERFIKRENLPYDYRIAGSVSQAREILGGEQFDAVLVDYLLGDGTAFDLIGQTGETPVLMITGSGDEAIAVEAMKAGAYDYLIKDAEGNYLMTLPVNVDNALRRRQAEEELRQYREHLEELVEQRTAELQRANEELARANEQLRTEITERERTEGELQRYTERLRTLRAVDGAILAAWSPEEIGQATLRHIRRLIPCLGAGITTFDFQAQEITLFAVHVNGEVEMEAGTHLPIEGVVDIKALQQGKTTVVDDTLTPLSTDPGEGPQRPLAFDTLKSVEVRSYIAVPLIARGELIGSLALGSESPAAFAPEHIDIAREVADQLAVALHQARLRAALEAEQRRLEALVEHLPEGILLLNGERRILLVNPAAQVYLQDLTEGAEPPESYVDHVLTHLAGHPIEKTLEPPPEEPWHELQVPGPPRRVFEVGAQPMVAEAGAEGWVVLVRDVTHERDTQQLVQQQERLAAVGQLAGGIAHDFNNLLTTIMLYAQMPLSKQDLSPNLKRGLETIISESRQAARLVQQILDFSRRSPIETHAVDLQPFIKESIRVLRRTIPESISFVLEVEPGEYTVNADPTRIQQVLMNLVVNARDAMPKGGVLRIILSREEVKPGEGLPITEMEPGQWICLSVSDTGTGIPPEALPHIFEPFFTTKPRERGTGLGLAQVYGIVTQHEGHIGVETEEGKGTTFRIYLPVYQAEEEEGAQTEALALTAPAGKGESILLVEDDERIRTVAQGILESLNYRVLTAGDGSEALNTYRSEEHVDLVITDIVMPEMGGPDLVRELRKEDSDLKAIAITGYVLDENRRELKEQGVQEVVNKPFDASALGMVVRRVLDED